MDITESKLHQLKIVNWWKQRFWQPVNKFHQIEHGEVISRILKTQRREGNIEGLHWQAENKNFDPLSLKAVQSLEKTAKK